MTQLSAVNDYYLVPRVDSDTIYQLWERGEAFNDSITPSAHCPGYRRWMVGKVAGFARRRPSAAVVSVGCGNAFVEADLTAEGHRLVAMDINTEAVDLAIRKGVTATVGDVFTWEPPDAEVGVVYADGLLGHLYEGDIGCQRSLARFAEWLVAADGFLVVSNDTIADALVKEAPGVSGFYWLSEDFLVGEMTRAGLETVEVSYYRYLRPISGPRRRLVVVGRR